MVSEVYDLRTLSQSPKFNDQKHAPEPPSCCMLKYTHTGNPTMIDDYTPTSLIAR